MKHTNTSGRPLAVAGGQVIEPGATIDVAAKPGAHDQALIEAGHLTPAPKSGKEH